MASQRRMGLRKLSLATVQKDFQISSFVYESVLPGNAGSIRNWQYRKVKMKTFEEPTQATIPIIPAESLLEKKQFTDEDNLVLCADCTQCCEYISLEIDKPVDLTDVDHIVWYLIHENVWVWVDEEDDWFVQFNTPCEKLEDSGRCNWYAHRPKICQDYKQAECPKYTRSMAEKYLFKNEDDFLEWLAHHRSKKMRKLRERYLAKRARRWQKEKPPNDNRKNGRFVRKHPAEDIPAC